MKVIVLEGINGAGKSEVGKRLQQTLVAAGKGCLLVDAAGFGPVGQLLRRFAVDPSIAGSANLDAVLFTALRSEGARQINERARSESLEVVLVERWSLALSAYGAADGADLRLLVELRSVLTEMLPVDQTVLLDVGGACAFERIKDVAKANRFEARGAEYLDDVARWYRHYAAHEGGVHAVDSSGDPDATLERVLGALNPDVTNSVAETLSTTNVGAFRVRRFSRCDRDRRRDCFDMARCPKLQKRVQYKRTSHPAPALAIEIANTHERAADFGGSPDLSRHDVGKRKSSVEHVVQIQAIHANQPFAMSEGR